MRHASRRQTILPPDRRPRSGFASLPSSGWEATRVQTQIATRFLGAAGEAPEERDIGRPVDERTRELFVAVDPAEALVQQFDHIKPEYVAVHDLGTSASRKLIGGLAAASQRPVQPYFRKESESYMTIAMRWRGPGGGVSVAELNLKLVWDVVAQIKVGQQGYAYVTDPNGILIAHPDISLVLQKTDLSRLPQVQAALAALRAPDAGTPDVHFGQDLRGNSVLTSFSSIGSLGWSVFVEQSTREAFSPLYESILYTLGLSIVGLGVAVVASLLLARNMVRPIQALQAGAHRVDTHLGRVRLGDGGEQFEERRRPGSLRA